MTERDMDRLHKQNAEFDALTKLAQKWGSLQRVAVVDDDYPELRHAYEGALKDFLTAVSLNRDTAVAEIGGALTLQHIQQVNVRRCVAAKPQGFNHQLDDWTFLEWAGAMCGEAGEAANAAKKISRIDMGNPFANREHDRDRDVILDKVADECGDTILYALLLLNKCGVKAEAVLRRVFNRKSDELGSNIKL